MQPEEKSTRSARSNPAAYIYLADQLSGCKDYSQVLELGELALKKGEIAIDAVVDLVDLYYQIAQHDTHKRRSVNLWRSWYAFYTFMYFRDYLDVDVKARYKGQDKQARYRKYLRSKEWRAKRVLMHMYYRNSCALCSTGSEMVYHVHHRQYFNFGKERMCDLLLLCPQCHNDYHVLKRKREMEKEREAAKIAQEITSDLREKQKDKPKLHSLSLEEVAKELGTRL